MARFRAAMDLDDLAFAGAAEQARRIAARARASAANRDIIVIRES